MCYVMLRHVIGAWSLVVGVVFAWHGGRVIQVEMPGSSSLSSMSSGSSQDAATDTNDVAVGTDPDCLGPCEPGTNVALEGIVWHESENGNIATFLKALF